MCYRRPERLIFDMEDLSICYIRVEGDSICYERLEGLLFYPLFAMEDLIVC